MPLNTRLQKVATATTAASGATNKVTAMVTGIIDAMAADIGKTSVITPNMANKFAEHRANAVANISTFQTSLGL